MRGEIKWVGGGVNKYGNVRAGIRGFLEWLVVLSAITHILIVSFIFTARTCGKRGRLKESGMMVTVDDFFDLPSTRECCLSPSPESFNPLGFRKLSLMIRSVSSIDQS